MNFFNALPEEIIQQILLKVEFSQIFNECALVCSDWNKLINNKQFLINKMKETVLNYPDTFRDLTEDEFNFCKKYIQNINKNTGIPLATYESSSFCNIYHHYTFAIAENPNCFWVSKGYEESNDEYLTYGICFDIAIIKNLQIQFANFSDQDGSNILLIPYSVKIEIKNGKGKLILSQSFDVELNCLNHIFTFSKEIFMTSDCRIRVYLIGKREKYPLSQKYHVGIKRLYFYGKAGVEYPYYFNETIKKKPYEDIVFKCREIIFNKNLLHKMSEYCDKNRNLLTRNQTIDLFSELRAIGALFRSRMIQ